MGCLCPPRSGANLRVPGGAVVASSVPVRRDEVAQPDGGRLQVPVGAPGESDGASGVGADDVDAERAREPGELLRDDPHPQSGRDQALDGRQVRALEGDRHGDAGIGEQPVDVRAVAESDRW